MAEFIGFQPNDYFNSVLWTGTGVAIGSGGTAITGVGFQPDLTWIKRRENTDHNCLFDPLRGATEIIHTSSTDAETASAESLASWNSDGFVVGNLGEVNGTTQSMIAWNWKAGTTGTDLSAGTITPSASTIDTTRKFGIYKYVGNGVDGATMAHGLGAVPNAIIIKRLDATYDWQVGQSYLTAGNGNDWDNMIKINSNSNSDASSAYWYDTTPTSTLITLGSHDGCNGNTNTYIMYVWCDVPGMQKFGMFHGNGNANGSAINLGFRPALLITKRLSTSQWNMFSDTIPGYNLTPNRTFANTNAAQSTSTTNSVDFLANGFKLRGSGDETNGNQNNYIYFAWSKFPTVSSNDIPGVAR